jgi:hypothetical protein
VEFSERQFRLKVKLERPIKRGPRQLQTRKRLSRSCRPHRSFFETCRAVACRHWAPTGGDICVKAL